MAVHVAAGHIHFSLAVDGVVAGREGIEAAARDGDLPLGLHGFSLCAAGRYAAAAHQQVAPVHVGSAAAFLVANLDGLDRHAVAFLAGRGDGKGSAAYVAVVEAAVLCIVSVVTGTDAFAAGAGIHDGHGAARHAKVVVGLDAGRAGIFAVLAVVGHPAAYVDGSGAALHQHEAVGGDALFHGCLGGNVEGSAAQPHVVVGFDAVTGLVAGGDGDGRSVLDVKVVVGGDAALAGGVRGCHCKAAASAHKELPFREQHGFHVFFAGFIGGLCGIGERVGAVNHHVALLLSLVVDGSAGGVRDGHAVQHQGLAVARVTLEETVGGAALEDTIPFSSPVTAAPPSSENTMVMVRSNAVSSVLSLSSSVLGTGAIFSPASASMILSLLHPHASTVGMRSQTANLFIVESFFAGRMTKTRPGMVPGQVFQRTCGFSQ